MSSKNFYQTFYQTDALFRLADDPWGVVNQTTAESIEESSVEVEHPAELQPKLDLLTELDALSTGVSGGALEPAPTRQETAKQGLVPEPVVIVSTPEPLPQPPPRPTTPSILPPIQQPSRLPQLNHKVLLLADEALDPSNLLFLEKILKAVNLNVNGVDLLNLHGVQDVNFTELLRGKYIHHFITFGVPFERIHLDIMMDRYAPVRFEGITFLMADSLPTIEADQNLKKRLWGALQRVFLR
ncbi:hypothetical protein [Spirosoma koreense]